MAFRTHTLLASAAGLLLAAATSAQQPAYSPSPQPAGMPGVQVGTASRAVVPVGVQLPKAAPQVGTAIGGGGITGGKPGGPLGPNVPGGPQPQGQVIDMKNVVAPYPGMPKPEPTFWEKLEGRWFGMFESVPEVPRAPNFTPGLVRRNRERREKEEIARRLRD